MPIDYGTNNVNTSGVITAASGNFLVLQVNGTGVSVSGHAHTSSDITNFNTAVSGLLPTIANSGDNRILTSTGSSVGVNAESNLSFDGNTLTINSDSPTNTYIKNIVNAGDYTNNIGKIVWHNVYNDVNVNIVQIDVSTDDSSNEGMLVFHTNDGTSLQERVRITDIGRVGIGTPTPSSSLQVVGLITSNSGNFTNSLQLNGTGVSISGHAHTPSDITDFNSSVSGLFSKTYSVFSAIDNQPPASGFATLDTRNSVAVLDFDDTTKETAVFVGVMPQSVALASGLSIRTHWMATTATSGDCRWEISLERSNTDLDSDSFDAVATGSSTTNGTAGIPTVTSITLTTIDSVAAGDLYRLRVSRDAANGADTMVGDAELIAVEVRSAQ